MRRTKSNIICLAAALLLTAPAFAQVGGERPTGPVEFDRTPARDISPTDPLPTPILPTLTFSSDEMQLVGFTRHHFAGNQGILNLSLACQREFAMSRMCTVEEIRMSVIIPEVLGSGAAWVQNIGRADETPDMNCKGWMSNASREVGTAIDLGECYGGIELTTCDSFLAVACCATEGTLGKP